MKKLGLPSVLLLTLLAGPAGGVEVSQTFCQRLAPELGLHFTTDTRNKNEQVWKTDTASLGMHLVGGTAATSISLTPPDGEDVSSPRTLDACAYTRKGVVCQVEGPTRLHMRTRRAEASLDAAPGERAEVEIRNTVVLCRDRE